MSNEQLMDENSARDTYKFLNALLDDYNACKTELARGGILKAYRMLLERVSTDHLKQIDRSSQLEKDLEAAKAKIPKTKEEITKLLNEAGFHELEECESGTWHCQVSPDLSPKTYAELYKKYYGDPQPDSRADLAVPQKFDPQNDSFQDFAKVKQTCNEAMTKIAKDEVDSSFKDETEDQDSGKQMTPEEFFGVDDPANEDGKNSKDTKKSPKKLKTSKSKTTNVAKNKNITKF